MATLKTEFGPYLSDQTIATVLTRQLTIGRPVAEIREAARQELAEILAAF
ncbi:hypothetical protein M6D93_13755 [Jatrophihabitans telluris]|uniref:Uncharacterized protein n=1 Tax=Jatrophihabitans telluris TaxID=2038343 RepID=A0ABY4QVP8_9ACTN|nr:hypothetical protein [Jatrophihabitans telluris]UQX87359.1 hypothetical protein M6D93_13755 [Jatrophihabitans telluris]